MPVVSKNESYSVAHFANFMASSELIVTAGREGITTTVGICADA